MCIINKLLIALVFMATTFNSQALSVDNMITLDCENSGHNVQAAGQVADHKLYYDGRTQAVITAEKIAIVKQSRMLFKQLSGLCSVSSAMTIEEHIALISSRLSLSVKYLDKVYFATGSAHSDSVSFKNIKDSVASFKESSQAMVIIGSADSVGNSQFNQQLALNRAGFIASKLDNVSYPVFLISLGDSVARKYSNENDSQPFFRRADVYLLIQEK